MAEALIRAESNGGCRKGDIVEWRGNDSIYGRLERAGRFVIVKFADATLQEMDDNYPIRYQVERELQIIEWQAEKLVLKLTRQNAGPRVGKLTIEDRQRFAQSFAAMEKGIADNEATFEVDVRNLAQSPEALGFGAERMSKLIVNYVGTDKDGYIYDLDYGPSGMNSTYIERTLALNAGATVRSNSHKVVRFVLSANQIEALLKKRVAETREELVETWRYHIPESVVDEISAEGNVRITDKVTFLAMLHDKKDN